MTPEVKLALTLAGLTVGLFAFFWGIALFLQGYLYSQVADRLPVRAAVSALLVACRADRLDHAQHQGVSHPDKYGVLVGFDRMMTPDLAPRTCPSSRPSANSRLKDEKGKPREQAVKFVWDGRDGFVEPESQGQVRPEHVHLPDRGPAGAGRGRAGPVRGGAGERPVHGREEVRGPGRPHHRGGRPRGSCRCPARVPSLAGLLVNAGAFVLWLVAFWLGMRFALGHAAGLTAAFGLATMIVLMPLLFNANTPKPGLVAKASGERPA